MEMMLAAKLAEMEEDELMQLLTRLKMEDRDAFMVLKELIDDL